MDVGGVRYGDPVVPNLRYGDWRHCSVWVPGGSSRTEPEVRYDWIRDKDEDVMRSEDLFVLG